MNSIPVVDLFAGPGGLSEGFATWQNGTVRFNNVLSIEKDQDACSTLRMRKFRLNIPAGSIEHYNMFLRDEITIDELVSRFPQAYDAAEQATWQATLGAVSREEVFRRIEEKIDSSKDWLLIGGPPCQAYSLAGRARIGKHQVRGDARNHLYRHYLEIIARFSPVAFVMENVRGIVSSRDHKGKLFERVLSDLRTPNTATELPSRLGANQEYQILSLNTGAPIGNSWKSGEILLKAESHGIPQARHRVILVGIRIDGVGEFANSIPPIRSLEPTTVLDAIGDLPRLRSKLSYRSKTNKQWHSAIRDEADLLDATTAQGVVNMERALSMLKDLPTSSQKRRKTKPKGHLKEWYLSNDPGIVLQHSTRGHMASDLVRYLYASAFARKYSYSPRLKDFPEELLPQHSNVDRALSSSSNFSDRFRVQMAHHPSTTITAHISKDGHYYIHYDPAQCRSLTLREAARLQTFPDDYLFVGSQTSALKQVGNAVPPRLANLIAEAIAQKFE